MPEPKVLHAVGELLSPWLEGLCLPEALAAASISGMTLDSRQIKPGEMFVAVKGHSVDGRRFIAKAQQAGAALVLAQADTKQAYIEQNTGGAVIYLPFLGEQLSAIAKRFYGAPDEQIDVVAVTGTNGKTTISQLLAQWAMLLGQPAGVMGTTGNGLLDQIQPATNTTGSALEIPCVLQQMAAQGARFAAMEVSSHGLVQGRVKALAFKASIFTNLSRDHLDYHGDMASYAEAKKTLFTEHQSGVAVINADDVVGREWLADLPQAVAVAMEHKHLAGHQGQTLWLESVEYSAQGVTVAFDSSWGAGQFTAPLVGAFNVTNLLLSLATLLATGHQMSALLAVAPQLQAVTGRMEVFQKPDKPMMVVDYAHTPDALEKALQALRVHCHGKLWCIFGCGGDRDRGKRPLMAQAAESLADKVILTDDNPRSESPSAIMADMLAGLAKPEQAQTIHERREACQWALTQAGADDIVLVAGKGHEDYQILADRTIHYSDRETVAELLEAKG
ncbi:UDP-N-acetylmuramoyl-L-alanyl-D-glutamate--2,6-diaminopimelate ligase [Photobacterium lutimaris]|uniref:UDP-N-acetylmuramoyl-L-alanyl-D-glutamate--2,6-diaminopimelate ligase n=1 Tax=Photobacterium lutimaris TaxID=388278 RepID=A0A2T3IWA9_9GAMM|nr:UDP-N-acetylmuramoyl-L-alanyl-D-glutamate--2,6-diaminopimelate ligase [Photobacterium lutimaris]PSU32723.1 UDP-N-acetylmuramoyl-L-alanyl-D-glutamate--2,6-diaminopimelate ligase [Photobacterium lutimaris]TDR74332.1 UDP-N-acetylmuramoylalanyl-D-glutamate--2,6-diaminopimelate ligase [Photobacterium lutimaris]